ncbi:CapA family protein [Evansella halocellulosilytica]|uniref:CapA family protein n=1 Tax=Evansella halocellulosilytica TaxID=2011013 RepID=UPI000BB7C787|nr:CapA family protein [Evansella halocellulosilytica]
MKSKRVFKFIVGMFFITLLVFISLNWSSFKGIYYVLASETNVNDYLDNREFSSEERNGTPNRKMIYEAEIGAVGDVLLHSRVYVDAETDEGYDFLPMLEPVESYISELDFAMANQESIPGGSQIGLSTYPLFNSPTEIADDLQAVGFNLLSMANNHSLDAGLEGIYSAIEHLNDIDMPYVGVYESEDDRNEQRIFDVNGIDFGVLSYTYGTNGIPIPPGHEYSVALLEKDKMIKDVQELKNETDVVVVHAHWGDEYARTPNQQQTTLARELVEAGADVIFGHHPHVLQPIEWIEGEQGRKGIVFYSLGNFLSGQDFEYTDIGGIGRVNVKKVVENGDTKIELDSPDILPTFVHHENQRNRRVILLEEAYGEGYIDKSDEKIINHTEAMMN